MDGSVGAGFKPPGEMIRGTVPLLLSGAGMARFLRVSRYESVGAQLEPRVNMLRADAIDVLDVEQAVPEAPDLAPGVVSTARASSQLYIVIEHVGYTSYSIEIIF